MAPILDLLKTVTGDRLLHGGNSLFLLIMAFYTYQMQQGIELHEALPWHPEMDSRATRGEEIDREHTALLRENTEAVAELTELTTEGFEQLRGQVRENRLANQASMLISERRDLRDRLLNDNIGPSERQRYEDRLEDIEGDLERINGSRELFF